MTAETNSFDDLKSRGFLYQTTAEDSLRELLSKEKVTFYVGFDPTGSSLHVGHLLPVMAMRRLQKAGHRPIVLIGGATGLVGDPSGKSEARPILSREKVAENVAGLRRQLEHFLDPAGTLFVNNADWFSGMLYLDFLRDIGSKFSVNRMLTAESVKMRLETGLSFLEFNYMILQAYDFFMLNQKYNCRLQLGGQDQWGNITCGTELVRRIGRQEVFGLTMPLLMKSNGEKFGKSAGGAVWLDPDRTSVFDYYQFWRNTADADVRTLLFYFTSLPGPEIESLTAPGCNINRAKEILAYEATALAHGEQEALRAFTSAGSKFGFADPHGEVKTSSGIRFADTSSTAALEDLPACSLELPPEGLWIVRLFPETGLCKSNGEARRLIQAGGAYWNDERINDPDRIITAADFTDGAAIVRAGKKNVKRIVLKERTEENANAVFFQSKGK